MFLVGWVKATIAEINKIAVQLNFEKKFMFDKLDLCKLNIFKNRKCTEMVE